MQHRLVVTDILGQPVGPIFKRQTVGFLDVEDETYRLFEMSVTKYQSMQCNIPEE